ncbi:HPr family phosphocarrier protein [Ethanoligenens harbinense]|uniref:Phosphotransferase system, phosphocarrier protein HPr n=1 Tax=Ethanoligenens harbinense (strain DSM 18485 / JCM 12961 / CGMCC 1.5033 / YUAN-3) TaxID=663278 RepID=E6U2J7_ETHHY|nr:HPr family phosphocarrier protein [Ethanoligenens harbinense]ADU26288.1 Phosphotransferase system, phosphocarrier protein HPr [Ethanoligenens harbinense YUAN-3]AVQ95422.1 HPr family phosphocarrier protein [Ethanoligenens harbinense YUAN-3]AYF38087.1 HPr family phosphocarrier protein [Ethanoligenens harbinense]AYF40832.1 HPr family phosphocarrier protein [Ethanoligenens harbinense]QCN91662.1 HPr family phosphocarrier protein [Ethanoligenens harbinense]
MKELQYVIKDSAGIHARPAGLLVKKAAEFSSKITLKKDGKSADARRLFAIMGLGAKQGENLTIEIDGADEDAAAEAFQAFLAENL